MKSTSSSSLSLSTKGLANVPINESRNDFEFVVGDTTYHCPSLIADFLSPRIAQLHSIDDTISRIVIEIKDKETEFGAFISLRRGQSLLLTESNRNFHLSVSKELCNYEVYDYIFRLAEGDISISNVIDRIKIYSEIGSNCETEIGFAASHFFEISSSDFWELRYETLRDILQRHELKVESEDWLYELISRRISSDSKYFELLELIRFEFVSSDVFSEYLEVVSNSFEYFTISHWRSLHSRLILPVSPKQSNDRLSVQPLSFPFSSSSPLSGIIANLTSRYGGNVHDRGIVNITANRPADSRDVPKVIADLGDNSEYMSTNDENQSICFDFKTLKIKPTHYTIRTQCAGPNKCHLKNWVIEGSTDGTLWVEIDRRENNSDLNNSKAIQTFSVSKVDTFRMIRLRQTGENHYNDYHLGL
jgi:hypothetical protein